MAVVGSDSTATLSNLERLGLAVQSRP